MEDAITPKTKPGVLLLCTAVALLALRAVLHYAIAMRKSGDPSYALGYSAARAIVAPAVVAGLFCIAKNGRHARRFTKGVAIASAIMLLLDLGQLGQTANP